MDNISLASLFIYITLSIPIKIINSQSGLTMGSGAYMVADDGSPDTIWFMGTQSGSLPYYIWSNTQGTMAYVNVYGVSSASMAKVGLWTFETNKNSQWQLNTFGPSLYQIAAYTGTNTGNMCLYSNTLGSNLVQYSCTPRNPLTEWKITFGSPIGPLIYFTSTSTTNVLQASGGSTSSGTLIILGNAFTGVQGQYFGIQQVSTGIWNIYELNSLLVLSSSGSVGTSVKLVYDISLYQLSPSTTFQWYFTFSEDFCSITIQSGTGLCLQNMGLNNPAQLQNCVSGSSNQKWTINPAQNSFQLFSISNGDTLSLANPTIIDTILTAVPYNSCSMNQFVFNKYGQLQSILSGRCVSVVNSVTTDNAYIDMEPCDTKRLDQILTMNLTSNTIAFKHSSKCLTYIAIGQPLVQLPCTGDIQQQWTTNLSTTGYNSTVSITPFVNPNKRSIILENQYSFISDSNFYIYNLSTFQNTLNTQNDLIVNLNSVNCFASSLSRNLPIQCIPSVSIACSKNTNNEYYSLGIASTQQITLLTLGIGPTCSRTTPGLPCGLLLSYSGGTYCALSSRGRLINYFIYCDLSQNYGYPKLVNLIESPICTYNIYFVAAEGCNGTIGIWTSSFTSTSTTLKTITTNSLTTITTTTKTKTTTTASTFTPSSNISLDSTGIFFSNSLNIVLVVLVIFLIPVVIYLTRKIYDFNNPKISSRNNLVKETINETNFAPTATTLNEETFITEKQQTKLSLHLQTPYGKTTKKDQYINKYGQQNIMNNGIFENTNNSIRSNPYKQTFPLEYPTNPMNQYTGNWNNQTYNQTRDYYNMNNISLRRNENHGQLSSYVYNNGNYTFDNQINNFNYSNMDQNFMDSFTFNNQSFNTKSHYSNNDVKFQHDANTSSRINNTKKPINNQARDNSTNYGEAILEETLTKSINNQARDNSTNYGEAILEETNISQQETSYQ